jgi:Ca2+-dependent lipid-binding protein
VCLIIDCVNGKDMPSVNTFGGCDPFVEFRLVKSHQDPVTKKGFRQGSKTKEGLTVQTASKDNESNPEWNETLQLLKAPIRKDWYLQVILWDKNMMADTPLGHQTFLLEKLLEGLAFVANETTQKRNSRKIDFKSLLGDGNKVHATIQCKFSYVDMLRFSFNVVKGSRFPKVKLLGTIDGFVELRVERQDVRKKQFESYPGESCVWSSKTTIVQDSMDPKFNQEFDVVLPARAPLQLQVIIWDSNSPLPDSPIAHGVLDLMEVAGKPLGKGPQEHKIRFKCPPGVNPAGDVKKTTVAVSINHQQLFVESSQDD